MLKIGALKTRHTNNFKSVWVLKKMWKYQENITDFEKIKQVKFKLMQKFYIKIKCVRVLSLGQRYNSCNIWNVPTLNPCKANVRKNQFLFTCSFFPIWHTYLILPQKSALSLCCCLGKLSFILICNHQLIPIQYCKLLQQNYKQSKSDIRRMTIYGHICVRISNIRFQIIQIIVRILNYH